MEFLRVSLRFLRRPAIGGARQVRLGQCFQHFRFRHIQWDPLCVPLDGRVWKSAEDIPSAPAVFSSFCVSRNQRLLRACVWGLRKPFEIFKNTTTNAAWTILDAFRFGFLSVEFGSDCVALGISLALRGVPTEPKVGKHMGYFFLWFFVGRGARTH